MIDDHDEIDGGEGADEPMGLECRSCGCRHFEVVYTRRAAGRIIRRRQCRHCGRRISTTERETGTPDEGPGTEPAPASDSDEWEAP